MSPGGWTHPALTGRPAKRDDLGIDFDGVFDDLADLGGDGDLPG